mmetsp:Transcript_39669/g.38241  ORF Transcript_39669/g.38241 Transcript_39669/m.38241 type:complete len:180 (+) Transcript_39669:1375-1914(+)
MHGQMNESNLIDKAVMEKFEGGLMKSEILSEDKSMLGGIASGIQAKLGSLYGAQLKIRLVGQKSGVVVVISGQEYMKEFIFEKDPASVWPEKLQLVFTNGTKISDPAIDLDYSENQAMALVKFRAPNKAGKYCSFFQLRIDKKLKVGPKVFLELDVRKGNKVEEPKDKNLNMPLAREPA